MRHLANYIAAARQFHSTLGIESATRDVSTWQEDGFEVTQETVTYRFADGAAILCTTERDSIPAEAGVCPECWITYEVVSDGSSNERITPARMTFDSNCREAFWIKYHASPSEEPAVPASGFMSTGTPCHDAAPVKESS
jgi:hypothetical protein